MRRSGIAGHAVGLAGPPLHEAAEVRTDRHPLVSNRQEYRNSDDRQGSLACRRSIDRRAPWVGMLARVADPRDLDDSDTDARHNQRSVPHLPVSTLSAAEEALVRFDRRAHLYARFTTGISLVFAVLASALPIVVFVNGIRSIGTTSTTVHADLALSLALALSVFGLGVSYIRGRGRKRELHRVRQRAHELERRLQQASSSALSDALDGLSSGSVITRVGAIHLLGRLASDSIQNTVAIQAVLSAFIREYSSTDNSGTSLGRPDLLAAVTVLGQALFIPNTNGDRLRLNNVDLRGLDISHLTLVGVDFSGANLEECNLSGTILDGSTFTGSNLKGANLFRASLMGVLLDDALLDDANAGAADFSLSLLTRCSLRHAFLVQANFREAFLAETDFSNANLRDAKFSGAFIREISIGGAILTGVNLQDLCKEENALEGNTACDSEGQLENSRGTAVERHSPDEQP